MSGKNSGGGRSYRKEIYIRDVLKEWYVNGINGSVNSIERLISFLNRETEGYSIVTVGNSAGGYLAVILGIALSAEYVLDFSGQNDIWEYAFRRIEYPELFLAQRLEEKRKYFNIASMIEKSDLPVFYFYAAHCTQDIDQYQFIRNYRNIYSFAFSTKEHGVTAYPFNLPYIVNMEKNMLMELQRNYDKKLITQREFAYRTMPFIKFWLGYSGYLFRRLLKELKRLIKRGVHCMRKLL